MQFKNVGYLLVDLTEDQLIPIKREINEIQNNFSKFNVYSNTLAGNLKKQYQLIKSKEYINNLLMPFIETYENNFNYLKFIDITTKDLILALDNVWVNFQKKYEFNPLHNHCGVFSFVIWIDIPYDIKDEMSMDSSKNSNCNIPGHFQFVTINSLGNLIKESIPVDKTYNGKLCIFPAQMNHCVYPFYTSDKYRITISGNFKLKVD
jgi:hypothetical protein